MRSRQRPLLAKRRVNVPGLVATLALASIGPEPLLAESESSSSETNPAYLMTLQILSGTPSCGDEWSRPEYYATASRRDPEVEKELSEVRTELVNVVSRIEAYDERIAPLVPREHITVPLTDDERLQLETQRGRRQEIQQLLKNQDRIPYEERRDLEDEQSDIERSVRNLENSIPLTDEEKRFLRDQREHRAPLDARRRTLRTLKADLTALISMRTPGSLRVYPEDELLVRLMESDAFDDDTCAAWSFTLEPETLARGGTELKRGDSSLVRLWIQRDSRGIDN